jgi:hypothetical protein
LLISDRSRDGDRHYRPSEDWDNACYQWINDVRDKLEAWNPRFLQRFDSVDFQDMLGSIIHMGRPDIDEYPALRELHAKRGRPERILINSSTLEIQCTRRQRQSGMTGN